MSDLPFGILPAVQQPWGFDGVKREQRGSYGDSRAFYVQPDHLEATDDNSGEDPAHPLATIARAIALARAYMGDVIYVMGSDSWQYGAGTQTGIVESVIVPVTKPGIAIIGVGKGAPGVYWRPSAANGWCLTIRALDVVVKGFTFWGGIGLANGIYCEWNGPTAFGENTLIEECTFGDGIVTGIQLEYAYYVHVKNCHFDRCNTYGVYSDPAHTASAYCHIEKNWFHDCGAAISVVEADSFLIEGNKIYNANAQGGALATNEGINTGSGQNNIVVDNFFSCLLPVPANGDYDNLNSASPTDAWVGGHCLNGLAITNPT